MSELLPSENATEATRPGAGESQSGTPLCDKFFGPNEPAIYPEADFARQLERRVAELERTDDITMTAFEKLADTCKVLRDQRELAIAAKEQAERRGEVLAALLTELHAMVWGECPSLLNEDSGGSARLDMEINAALSGAKSDV